MIVRLAALEGYSASASHRTPFGRIGLGSSWYVKFAIPLGYGLVVSERACNARS
jgi:hypothetical protein